MYDVIIYEMDHIFYEIFRDIGSFENLYNCLMKR